MTSAMTLACPLCGLRFAARPHLALLCLSRGEASPLNSTGYARLEAIRPWELQLAASVLGISQVTVASFADGRLSRQPGTELGERLRAGSD